MKKRKENEKMILPLHLIFQPEHTNPNLHYFPPPQHSYGREKTLTLTLGSGKRGEQLAGAGTRASVGQRAAHVSSEQRARARGVSSAHTRVGRAASKGVRRADC
jgi:hypothetical protein